MPGCGGRTGAAIEERIERCTAVVGESKLANKAEEDSYRPKGQPSSSQAYSDHCEVPMAESTRRLPGSAKNFQGESCAGIEAGWGLRAT
jgi:superfamily II RNA helicase